MRKQNKLTHKVRSSRALPSRGFREILTLLPAVSAPVVESTEALMRGPSPLTPAEREFIYQYCSRANGCTYAATSHSSCAIELGMPKKAFRSPPARLKPLLRFARKLTLTPASITSKDASRLLGAGWDERAIVDVIYICALVGWTNRVLLGFLVPIDKERLIEGGAKIAEHGYLPTVKAIRAASRS
jgi:uncharacterized peroxidase-related enzyme